MDHRNGGYYWGFAVGSVMMAIVTGHTDKIPGAVGASIVAYIGANALDRLLPKIGPKLQAKAAVIPRRYFYGALALVGLLALWPATLAITLDPLFGVTPSLERVLGYYVSMIMQAPRFALVWGLPFGLVGLVAWIARWMATQSESEVC